MENDKMKKIVIHNEMELYKYLCNPEEGKIYFSKEAIKNSQFDLKDLGLKRVEK